MLLKASKRMLAFPGNSARNNSKKHFLSQYRCSHFSIVRLLDSTQEPLVVVEPRTPPTTNVGIETAFRHDHCKHFQKENISEVRGHLMRSNPCRSSPTSIYMLSFTDFEPQTEPFPRSEFTPGCIWTYWMLVDRQMQQNLHESSRAPDRLIAMVNL